MGQEYGRRADSIQPLTEVLEVLLITTKVSHPVCCAGLLSNVIFFSSTVNGDRAFHGPFYGQNVSLCAELIHLSSCVPLSARPGAFPDVARVNETYPAVLVFCFQGSRPRCLFRTIRCWGIMSRLLPLHSRF